MYFESRAEAGEKLASELFEKYRFEDCAVVALNDGGILVGEPVAARLHSVLAMIVSEDIEIPGESLMINGVSQNGNFVRNSFMTQGEFEGYQNEFFGYFEQLKRESFQKINRLLGEGGTIELDLLRDRNIILVSDGLSEKSSIDVAIDFLKPVRYKKLIVISPVASVATIDRLHITADELHVLDVKANYLDTSHYYDDNNIPSHEESVKKINDIILNWQ